MNEEKLKEMTKPNKVGRAREFLQYGRKDEVYGDNEYYRKGFLDGGLYADEHPKNPWISVKERLPQKYAPVLTIDTHGLYDVDQYNGTEWEMELPQCPYTHWMPIPQLKKGE